jgi:hypothetical protein
VKRPFTGLLIAVVVAASGCILGGTSLVQTWHKPGLQAFHFRKVLAFAPARDPVLRRTMEDELVLHIGRAQAIPSYEILKDRQVNDKAAVGALVREYGFDGVVAMRILGVTANGIWVPGRDASNSIDLFGGPMWDVDNNTDSTARIETQVYTVPGFELVWAAVSSTYSPSSARQMARDVAGAVGKRMRKEGLFL